MRLAFSIVFLVLIAALGVCAVIARRSKKTDGTRASILLVSLLLPVIGNLIIVLSDRMDVATSGYLAYFLGMDLVMFALLRFTVSYCRMKWPAPWVKYTVRVLLILDGVQLLLNLHFGHAFALQGILVDNRLYYHLLPYLGQIFHRLLDYGILLVVMVIFVVKSFQSSRLNSRRYFLVFLSMLLAGTWETFYIASGMPFDSSMISFGIFGILIFYFALYYRPVRVLDRMLAAIASELPEALFFFDASDQCIWVNPEGIRLAGVKEGSFELATEWLTRTYGPPEKKGEGWTSQRILEDGEDTRCYILEKHVLTDSRNRTVGSFLRVRDNTQEQRTLQKEIFNATHDSLTGVYNRAGYNLLLSSLDLSTTFMLLADGDAFKSVNDTYGHEVGDRVLQKIADRMKSNFRPGDYVCRIGGDEFVILLLHAKPEQYELIASRIDRINEELERGENGLPPTSISVGIAHGSGAKNTAELFSQADRALYRTKDKGKGSYTFYEPEEP